MNEQPGGADRGEGRTELAPLKVNSLRIVEAGMAVWLVALVVSLALPSLHAGARSWWPWCCVAGLGIGVFGWVYIRRGRGNARDA
ncbi:MAG TPA: DUF2530 domain-containing protein [Segeticoccus sp.]|uniref:DUF2530 domain-containing protein n=1 Tax=Segeticoccus sp. TaxID=2706531 RepID=UPI002D80A72B|nr:DUF2530 domain-containing protein [Segeticoccus sp.]HET8601092.1 DUF2530 domain-containing protein [Segeticoccus sp.]